jgi:hypothetical protein
MKKTSDPKVFENDGTPVPMELWGKDHRTTMLYLESRAVDYGGRIDPRMMRTGHDFPTRLFNGDQLTGHDDWDCLNDAIAEGLLVEGLGTVGVKLTDKGWEYAGNVRRLKAESVLANRTLADVL